MPPRGGYGHFENEVIARWEVHPSEADRTMVLVEHFAYVGPSGKKWRANAGREIDGASIPEFLWGSIIGSAYTGDYRRATVVHDVACKDKTEPWDDVHRMFYYAMRCDNTASWLANVMYAAVRLFGPRWGTRRKQLMQSTTNIRAFRNLIERQQFVEETSLEQLDKKLDAHETRLRRNR